MELGMPNSGEAFEIVLYLNLIRENVFLLQASVVDPPQSSGSKEQRWPIVGWFSMTRKVCASWQNFSEKAMTRFR